MNVSGTRWQPREAAAGRRGTVHRAQHHMLQMIPILLHAEWSSQKPTLRKWQAPPNMMHLLSTNKRLLQHAYGVQPSMPS